MSSTQFFSIADPELEILYDFGDKASDGERAGAYYRNRKREATDFEKVYRNYYR